MINDAPNLLVNTMRDGHGECIDLYDDHEYNNNMIMAASCSKIC